MRAPKKRAITTGDLVGVRIQTDMARQLDDWRRKQDDLPGRPEAIRRLVELGLTVKATKPKQAPAARADRARELASKAIDKMGDLAAHPAERAQRHRRLTKGPEEFREVRVDRPKPKGSPK
jgi:hypothetical protein